MGILIYITDTEVDNMLIGSHVGMSGKDMFAGSVKEAISYGSQYIYGVHRRTSEYQKKIY